MMNNRYVSFLDNHYFAACGTFPYAGRHCLNWIEISREDCELLLSMGYVAH